MSKIVGSVHPDYSASIFNWQKYRDTYYSGKSFVEKYLVKFSLRETELDFTSRKSITYCPAHAKAVLNDIKNAIFQRTNDVTREGGSQVYQDSVLGLYKGVDRQGSTMNSFIGRVILPELLHQGKVGIYVDAPKMMQKSLANKQHPYIYMYQATDIRNWSYDSSTKELLSLLLRTHNEDIDQETGLVSGISEGYKLFQKQEGGILVTKFDSNGDQSETPVILEIPNIPFVIFEIQSSLLTDVADYQIALVNLESSDLNYALKSNFPFYTEMFNPNTDMYHRSALAQDSTDIGTTQVSKSAKNEIDIGAASGRRYPVGAERPGFIHPSSEPLLASIAKGDKLKQEIRLLVNLALSSIAPQRSSAESKEFDERGLESGLSYIGLELEFGERRLAQLWAEYEGEDKIATIKYPTNYTISSNAERRQQATELRQLQDAVPSKLYKQLIAKKIADTTIGADISIEDLKTIHTEILKAEVFDTQPATLLADHQAGFVSDELASKLRGYPAGEVEKAREDHANRLARISVAQTTPTRGVPDTEITPGITAKEDKNE